MIAALLTGGKSSRMGKEKATLIYRNETTEVQRLFALLQTHSEDTILCHREDQDHGLPFVTDPGEGPLSAIHALQQAYPHDAILVLACDLPLLEDIDIRYLLEQRDRSKDATSYISRHDQRPETLCTIYEASSSTMVEQAIKADSYCPRDVLAKLNIKLIETLKPTSLMNANTPAERLEVLSHLNNTRVQKTIQLRYFAQLQEQAGIAAETLTTSALTPAGLYEELCQKYNFTHKQRSLMVAINENFSTWEHELAEGDEVVFIPPVAGG